MSTDHKYYISLNGTPYQVRDLNGMRVVLRGDDWLPQGMFVDWLFEQGMYAEINDLILAATSGE
jgi:hypothetical protein